MPYSKRDLLRVRSVPLGDNDAAICNVMRRSDVCDWRCDSADLINKGGLRDGVYGK